VLTHAQNKSLMKLAQNLFTAFPPGFGGLFDSFFASTPLLH
jgi:hypothetical protein